MPGLNRTIAIIAVLSNKIDEVVDALHEFEISQDSTHDDRAVIGEAVYSLRESQHCIDTAGGALSEHFIDKWNVAVAAAFASAGLDA